ncbi:MAG: poly-gamma-glutamate hydrolase family protein [Planctomycetota bacterium]|jgi:phage replication-related protein YjqB (UPF0714/DUF867 family)
MADTFDARAYTAFTSQSLLIGYPERCSVDPDELSGIGRSVWEQIRLTHNSNGKKGILTVAQTRQESPSEKVRMCSDARARWGDTSKWYGTADKNCLRSNLSDAQAESQSEFVERLDETNTTHSDLVVCAPHGGMIEHHTDEQAERVYSQLSGTKNVSAWVCKGWRSGGGAYDAWHITSTEISTGSFPLLDSIKSRGFTYAVSFHGANIDTIAVGGGAGSQLKQDIADAIQNAVGEDWEVEVVTSGPYAGTSEDNFINWLANYGVQIEQPGGARNDYSIAIADAVAGVFASLL